MQSLTGFGKGYVRARLHRNSAGCISFQRRKLVLSQTDWALACARFIDPGARHSVQVASFVPDVTDSLAVLA